MSDSLDSIRQIALQPDSYDFFAALRRIECAFANFPRIGESLSPKEDAVRLGQIPSLAFEPAMIGLVQLGEGKTSPKVLVNFFGLLGVNGAMPIHITEYVRDRMRNSDDYTLVRFLDVFHHRMLSLLYRAWGMAQPALSLDRPDSSGFSIYTGSLIGIGNKALQNRTTVSDFSKFYYAGRLAPHIRNAEGLDAILNDFFKLPVKISQFTGHWMKFESNELLRLKSGQYAKHLGISTVIGTAVWDRQNKFSIIIGPIKLEEFEEMLPGSKRFQCLIDWVRQYVGDFLDWEVKLILKKEEVKTMQFNNGLRLGINSWILSGNLVTETKPITFNIKAQFRALRRLKTLEDTLFSSKLINF